MCSSNDSKRVHACVAQLKYTCDTRGGCRVATIDRSLATSAEHSMHANYRNTIAAYFPFLLQILLLCIYHDYNNYDVFCAIHFYKHYYI